MARRVVAVALAVVGIGLLSPTAAHAFPITVSSATVGSSFGVLFSGTLNPPAGAAQPGLAAQATFTLSSWTLNYNGTGNTRALFSVSLANVSASPVTASRVSGLGFNTTPNVAGGSVSGVFSNFKYTGNVSYPGNISLDACVNAGGNSCSGGGNGGLTLGQSGTLTLAILFSGAQSSATFDNMFVRYQSINLPGVIGGSGVGGGTVCANPNCQPNNPTPVPEPASLLLLGAGISVLAARLRRRNK